MSDVVIYGRPDRVCVKCLATKRWMKRHGIPHRFINVDEDPVAEAHIRALGALAVPVVQVDGGTWWSDHRIPELEKLAVSLDMLGDAA